MTKKTSKSNAALKMARSDSTELSQNETVAMAENALSGNAVPKYATPVRRISLPVLAATLLLTAVAAPAAYFWRCRQFDRAAIAWLNRADALEQKGDWGKAADYVYRYTRLRPFDNTTRVRLAKVFDKSAHSAAGKSRAIELYYHALGAAESSDQITLRRRLTELLLEQGRFADAEKEVRKILKSPHRSDPAGCRMMAIALIGQFREGKFADAGAEAERVGEAFDKALEQNPKDVALAATFAIIFRDHQHLLTAVQQQQFSTDAEREQHADRLIREMIERNPNHVEALLASFQYKTKYQLSGAEADLQRALRLAPKSLSVLMAAGNHAKNEAQRLRESKPRFIDSASERYDEAEKYYLRIIDEVAPNEAVAYLALGEVYFVQKRVEEAEKIWRRGLKASKHQKRSLNMRLAEALLVQNKMSDAERVIRTLEESVTQQNQRMNLSARLAQQRTVDLLRARWFARKGENSRTIRLLERVVADRPESEFEFEQMFRARMLMGRSHRALRQWDLAAQSFERAAKVKPGAAQPLLDAAGAWSNAQHPEIAAQQYARVLKLGQLSSAAAGEVLLAMGRAQLQHQQALPHEKRHWAGVEETLEQIRKIHHENKVSDPWRIDLLEADALAAQARENDEEKAKRPLESALEALRRAEKQHPTSDVLAQHLIPRFETLGRPDLADAVLKRLEKVNDQTVGNDVAEARRQEILRWTRKIHQALHGQTDAQKSVAYRKIGDLFSQVGDQPNAEVWYRRLAEIDPTQFRQLALCLAHQKRSDEALDVAFHRGKKGSTEAAIALAAVIATAPPDEVRMKTALAQLDAALHRRPRDANLLCAVANVRFVQKRTTEAIGLFERVLRKDPNHVLALNNLAILLAENSETRLQALAHIDRAIELAGSAPALYHTKGMVLVYAGNARDALPWLRQAARAPRCDPLHHFHLAIAYGRTGKLKHAATELEVAVRGNLHDAALTSIDVALLDDLQKKIETKAQ